MLAISLEHQGEGFESGMRVRPVYGFPAGKIHAVNGDQYERIAEGIGQGFYKRRGAVTRAQESGFPFGGKAADYFSVFRFPRGFLDKKRRRSMEMIRGAGIRYEVPKG